MKTLAILVISFIAFGYALDSVNIEDLNAKTTERHEQVAGI